MSSLRKREMQLARPSGRERRDHQPRLCGHWNLDETDGYSQGYWGSGNGNNERRAGTMLSYISGESRQIRP